MDLTRHELGAEVHLASPALLMDRLVVIPSKAEVEVWMKAWPSLDVRYGEGHSAELERALLSAAIAGGRQGFRAVWVVVLLCSRDLMGTFPEPSLLLAWHRATDAGCQRECLRALLHLDLSDGALQDLLEWSVHVVFLDEVPPALLHYAVRVMERASSRKGFAEANGFFEDIQEALDELRPREASPHLKKKAALLRARLSG